MEDLRKIIGYGQDKKQKFKWYIVSEGLRKKDGQPKLSGLQVRVFTETYCPQCRDKLCGHIGSLLIFESKFDEESFQTILKALQEEIPGLKFGEKHYFCMCEGLPHKEIECSHVACVKYFEAELANKGERLKTQREEEIRALQNKAASLEATAARYLQERQELNTEITSLKAQLTTIEDKAHAELEKKLKEKEKEYESINNQFRSTIEELQQAKDRIEGEKSVLEKINNELKEKLDQEKKARYKAVSIAESLKRARSSQAIPKEIIPYLSVLAELGEKKLNQRLGDLIYSNIPVSKKAWKEKINLGKLEHHQPRRLMKYLEKKARIKTIDQITSSHLDSSKETHFKKIYTPQENMPNGQKTDCWTIHWVYSDGDIGVNLYFKTTARNQVEAKLIVEKIQET